ncbi:MAG: hypothetical protein ACK4RK_04675 [Gemmataceae bacterium]
MHGTRHYWLIGCLSLLACSAALAESHRYLLPRFTEEREAAALFFVKKHVPDLVPMLEELKKNQPGLYEQEIREIFQVTELLAELMDEPRRYELELQIWKTENKAHTLIAKFSTPSADERKRIEEQLLDLARELVRLEMQVLELKAEQLDRELGEIKDELANIMEHFDKEVKERYELLLDKVKRPSK